MFYVNDCEADDDCLPRIRPGKSRSAERRAYTTLASVCLYWRQTLSGWTQSPTRKWLKKLTERECLKYCSVKSEQKNSSLTITHSHGSAKVL